MRGIESNDLARRGVFLMSAAWFFWFRFDLYFLFVWNLTWSVAYGGFVLITCLLASRQPFLRLVGLFADLVLMQTLLLKCVYYGYVSIHGDSFAWSVAGLLAGSLILAIVRAVLVRRSTYFEVSTQKIVATLLSSGVAFALLAGIGFSQYLLRFSVD